MADGETHAVLVLGAEEQAATSLALAYPERRFLFAGDSVAADGWDLPNVGFVSATPGTVAALRDAAEQVVPLSPRWMADPAATSLSTVLPRIAAALPAFVLPVSPRPGASRGAIAKGDAWHRPDTPIAGQPGELSDLTDTHGCGLVYQELIEKQGCVMAIGRHAGTITALGLFRVLSERFFHVGVLQAAETAELPELAELSRSVLAVLGHDGWFTLNWLLTDAGPRLSSFRPVPKAVFSCFRRGGLDLLAPGPHDARLAAGLRLIAMPHYAPFEMLEAR